MNDAKITKKSPCKINLMLAITGGRPDGFHNLVSLVLPVKFGDEISVEFGDKDSLFCNMEGIPTDSSNLILKAAELFRQNTNCGKFFKFCLCKRVPAGAGLGGGSSNGAISLLAINELCGSPLSIEELSKIAANMGSDCPLFLTGTPVVMRGRGEKVFKLSREAGEVLTSLKILIFKPAFSISTGWAYSQMRANPEFYISQDEAENKLSEWLENPTVRDLPLINNMQLPAFRKYPALELVLEDIRAEFRIPAMMSGSGSACFAIVNDLEEPRISSLKNFIAERLGKSCFIAEA